MWCFDHKDREIVFLLDLHDELAEPRSPADSCRRPPVEQKKLSSNRSARAISSRRCRPYGRDVARSLRYCARFLLFASPSSLSFSMRRSSATGDAERRAENVLASRADAWLCGRFQTPSWISTGGCSGTCGQCRAFVDLVGRRVENFILEIHLGVHALIFLLHLPRRMRGDHEVIQ